MTQTVYSYNKTITQLFEEQVEKNPQYVAIHLDNSVITYRELNQRANQCAYYLRSLGVKQNSIVGIEMNRSYEMIIAIFAVLKAGGAYLPIDKNNPLKRKQAIITNSQLQFLLIDESAQWKKNSNEFKLINIHDTENSNIENLENINSPHDIAYVIYTSGSTGTPKGVLIEHHSLVNRIEWMQEAFPLTMQDVIFQKTHYSFDVSVWEIVWWAIVGASVVLLPPDKEHDVRLFTKIINKYQTSVIHFVPSVFRLFLDYIETDFDITKLSSLKYVFTSGEELHLSSVNRFNAIFKNTQFPILVNLYGPTEATIDVSYFICNKIHDFKYIPIGRPINNINLMVMDDKFHEVGTDVPGELYISGVGVAAGYLNNETLTRKFFIDNLSQAGTKMYRTGDIVKWDHLGYLVYLGRKDDQIKLRGIRIELAEIQYHLIQHDDVKDAFVTCITTEDHTQILTAYIINRNKGTKNNVSELSDFLSERLPNYMVPTSYIFLDRFPLKVNGKIDRAQLIECAFTPVPQEA